MGYWEYPPIAERYRVPIVVTGFEPLDLVRGMLAAVRQLNEGRAEVENAYARRGHARRAIARRRRSSTRCSSGPTARGAASGTSRDSGLRLREDFAAFDAETPIRGRANSIPRSPPRCIAGEILQGRKRADRMPVRSESSARRRIRSARPWSRRKAPARRTIGTVRFSAEGGAEAVSASDPRPRIGRVPRAALHQDRIVLGHGSGGPTHRRSDRAALPPVAGRPALLAADDAGPLAELSGSGELAFSTDAHVVHPLVFPGGDIGRLSVCGTVNDLAMVGAVPGWLAAAFMIEEGFLPPTSSASCAPCARPRTRRGCRSSPATPRSRSAGKVDGLYITTPGVGRIPSGRRARAANGRLGDAVIVSGPLGNHGIAVLAARGDLAFATDIRSDTAPLNGLVEALFAAGRGRTRCAIPPAAASPPRSTRSPARAAWRSSWTRNGSRCAPRCRPPARCSGFDPAPRRQRGEARRIRARRAGRSHAGGDAGDTLRGGRLHGGPRGSGPKRPRAHANDDRGHADRGHAVRRAASKNLLTESAGGGQLAQNT